jgi:hypothetical protein
MKRKSHRSTRHTTTKSVLRLPDLEHAKAAVLNSLTSQDAQRGYRHAIDEFVDWYCSEPRLAVALVSTLALPAGLATLSGCGGGSTTPPPPPADFNLSVSPPSVSVPIGINSGTVQISIQPLNGFNQPVSVSLQGLPTGVTTMPASPFSVSPGTPQTVTLFAARGASAGVPAISVQANAGTLSHSGSFSISVAAAAVYTYVAGSDPASNGNAIAGYSVDPNTAAVTAVQGSPFSLAADPVTDMVVASEPGGTFLYAVTAGSATTLLGFRINPSSGVLTPIQTINYPSGFGEPRLAIHPSGRFLYAAQVTNCVVAYSIDPATGSLTQTSCSAQNPNGPLVIAPPGNFAYGADADPSSMPFLLTAYTISQSNGALDPFQSIVTNQANSLLYTDTRGHALYDLMTGVFLSCGDLSIWEIDPATGRLTSLNPSAGGPCTPWSMSFDPGSQFVYLTINIYRPYDGVYGAEVDPTSGNLTFISGPAGGSILRWAVVEPSQGKFLFVDNCCAYNGNGLYTSIITPYAIDPSTRPGFSPLSGLAVSVPLSDAVRMVIVAPMK